AMLVEDVPRTLPGPHTPLPPHAIPYPDGWLNPYRPEAAKQRRARLAPGIERGTRRDSKPAHQWVRRGARPADRARGDPRAEDPTGHRRRNRRAAGCRSARRLIFRRVLDRPDRDAGERVDA